MTGIEVARLVASTKGAHLFRQRRDVTDRHEYDVKEIFTGNKRGWTLLDLFSASAICSVWDALKPENQEKYARMNLPAMASTAFKLLK